MEIVVIIINDFYSEKYSDEENVYDLYNADQYYFCCGDIHESHNVNHLISLKTKYNLHLCAINLNLIISTIQGMTNVIGNDVYIVWV